MKQSEEDVISALKLIATESINLNEEAFYHMFNHAGIVGAVKDIVYLMFVNKVDMYSEKDDDVFAAISLVREFCQELDKYGEVRYDVKFDSDEYIKSLKK